MRIFYFETEDYNGLLIADGKRAYLLEDFPQDGTVEMAKLYDWSGFRDSENFEDIQIAMGANDLYLFDFNDKFKNCCETLVDLGEL